MINNNKPKFKSSKYYTSLCMALRIFRSKRRIVSCWKTVIRGKCIIPVSKKSSEQKTFWYFNWAKIIYVGEMKTHTKRIKKWPKNIIIRLVRYSIFLVVCIISTGIIIRIPHSNNIITVNTGHKFTHNII